MVEKFGHIGYFRPTQRQKMKDDVFKTLGTSIIYSPMSLPSALHTYQNDLCSKKFFLCFLHSDMNMKSQKLAKLTKNINLSFLLLLHGL